VLYQERQFYDIHNDAVIIYAGGILPLPFLKDVGVMIQTYRRKAVV